LSPVQSQPRPPLPKTAPLVYNIHSETEVLFSNLFSPSPLSQGDDVASLTEDCTSSRPLLLVSPGIPNQAKQAFCLRLSR